MSSGSVVLKYKKTGRKRRYVLLREEKNQFQGLRNQNSCETVLEVELLEEGEQWEQLFRISTLAHRQSNKEGFFKWVYDLQPLRKEVIAKTGQAGEMLGIENMAGIKNTWNSILGRLLSEHGKEKHAAGFIKSIEKLLNDKERLVQVFKYAPPYINFFPDIFNRELRYDRPVKGYTELQGFLGTKTVPIITEGILKEYDPVKETYEVERSGTIDQEHFRQDRVTALIRLLKNRPRVPAQVKLNYSERYLFDAAHWPLQALNMSLAYVPGTLYREEKTILKAV